MKKYRHQIVCNRERGEKLTVKHRQEKMKRIPCMEGGREEHCGAR